MAKAAAGREREEWMTSAVLVSEYLAYNRGQDLGANMADVLLHWYNAGTILAFAPVDHTNPAEVDAAMATFHGIYAGVNLTVDTDQLFEQHQPWTVANGQQPNPNDGQCMLKVAADGAQHDSWVTWGAVQQSTLDWAEACLEEAWVILTEEDVAATDFDIASWYADINALHGTGNGGSWVPPPPPPDPPPDAYWIAGGTAAGGDPVFEPPERKEHPPAERLPRLRRLQAEVMAGRELRRYAFRPGMQNTIGVHIGPGGEGPLVLAAPFPERQVVVGPSGRAELMIVLVSSGSEDIPQRNWVILPREGSTAQALFQLDVAAEANEVRCSILVFQEARLLQSAELRGPVSDADVPIQGNSLELVRTAENTSVPTDQSLSDVDASLSFHVGTPAAALLTQRTGPRESDSCRFINVQGMDQFRDRVVGLLQEATLDDEVQMRPGSPQQVRLLRGLARHGNLFYQEMLPQVAGLEDRHSLQFTTGLNQVIPLEFVYDYGFPSENAGLCPDWITALDVGACPRHHPRSGGTDLVCPTGFWGIRITLERQLTSVTGLAGQRHPGHDQLPALDRVLFAASANVDAVSGDERKQTITLFKRYLGNRLAVAESWPAWERKVAVFHPRLLVSLPHNDQSDDGLAVLEIGKSSRLEVGAVTAAYIASADVPVGPVVMLLGCSTATAEVPWQSAVAAFRRSGAAIVVGTLADTLGRQTAPLARELAEALWGPQAIRAPTIGAVMQTLRRRLLAQGSTLGMSLVAFGEADWVIATGN
jgi:hypothetical protein